MTQLYGFYSEVYKRVEAAVQTHSAELKKKPGVVGVRAGYRVVNNWITTTPAIVVSVNRKINLANLPEQDRVPPLLDGIPTDVVQVSVKEKLAHRREAMGNALVMLSALDDVRVDENVAPSGNVGDPTDDSSNKTIYEKPPHLSLPRFPNAEAPGDITVLCHASPDAGWAVLSEFFAKTRERLTVAIYDFTADHILKGLSQSLRAATPGELHLIIDPELKPTEMQVLETLKTDLTPDPTLPSKFDCVQALVTKKNKKGLFATAYHTKVAVRDGEALWLSSGNWSPSSQPSEDPFKLSPSINLHRSKNRDYHVVIPHAKLASTLANYIEWDRDQSRKHAVVTPPTSDVEADDGTFELFPDVLIPRDAYEAFFAKPGLTVAGQAPQYFPPREIELKEADGDYVQPLLTQDNYIEEIIKLIPQAERKLYLQFQYIRLRRESPTQFQELIALLKKKIDDKLDVRVIIGHRDARRDLENLVGIELDVSRFKVQMSCHNKAILVDDKFAVVGSQNWSGDGTTSNRDASLLFYSQAVYAYYEEIFLHDWERLAEQNLQEALTVSDHLKA